ncbi:signal peptidase I [Candidatus Woesearchaeota archaeon]|nr:signal peptidase I [Candidatus Woesearchaeota archaeon]
MKKRRLQSVTTLLKRFWHFLWYEDSWLSWIVNVILAFVIIKFLVYPGLGFLLGTTHPIVAVVSGSMEHDGSFDDWWHSSALCGNDLCSQEDYYMQYSITKEEFQEFRFPNGFNKGDIMVLLGTPARSLEAGDVIVFQSKRTDPIIHRIINVDGQQGKAIFQTKGDHNQQSIASSSLDEINIREEQIIGRAVLRIPYLGYIKIWFVQLLNPNDTR